MKHKHTYEVIVGNIGTLNYTNKGLAKLDYNIYVKESKSGKGNAANEPVTLMKDGEIIQEYIPEHENLIAKMFNLDIVKEQIAKCPEGEIVILCAHWSINCPKYPDSANPDQSDCDFSDFESQLDTTLLVNDYDDLIADPHGLYNA